MAISRARSGWLTTAVFVLAVGAAWCRHAPVGPPGGLSRAPSRPNIVVILVDDMGWSDIAPFGSEIATPNLDGIAARGVRFAQFYATPRCSPTRASLLTGLYSHQAGMGHLDNVIRPGSIGTTGRLNDESVTMAEVLRDAGYFTAMSGKWHLGQDHGSPPWDRGFERSLSLRAGGLYFPNQHYTGGDNPLTSRAQEPLFLNGTATPRDAPVFGTDWYATFLWPEWGLKFIDEAHQAGQPFFLYLPFNAPHFPLMAPAALIAKYRGRYKAGWDRLRQERYERQIRMGLIDPRWPLSPREADTPAWDSLSDQMKDRFDHQMAVYAAMIEAIDTGVGTLLKGLDARGVLDNTLIFFMSDNGANAESGPAGRFNGNPPGGPDSDVYLGMNWAAVGNTPFRRFKHFTHEGGIASPLIVSWPSGISANRRGAVEQQPAHVIDIMATVVGVTGATYPGQFKGHTIHGMEGTSLQPALEGRPLERAGPIFWEHEGNRAVRSGNWKIVSVFPGAWELYDIAADRVERHDVAAEHQDIVARLSAEWDAWATRTNVDSWPGPARLPWGDDAPTRSAGGPD